MQFNKALRYNILWKVVNTILTFFINVFLVRLLGAGQSGAFYYTVTILSLMVLLQGFSLESGVIYYGSKSPPELRRISGILMVWLLVQTIIAAVILSFLKTGLPIYMGLLFIAGNMAITYLTALFSAQKKFLQPNLVFATVNTALLLLLMVAYYSKTGNRLFNPALLYVVSFILQAVLLAFIFLFITTNKDEASQTDNAAVKKLFSFSTAAFAGNIIFFLATRVDYYFVSKYCTPEALGNYIQVSKLGQLLVLLPSVVAAVIFPYTASEKEQGFLDHTQFFCRIITWVFIPLILVISATGFWLFPLLYGDSFEMMYPATLFYLPGFFALSIVTVLAGYTGGKGMLGTNIIASFITLVVVVIVDILLIPISGINAAAIASSFAYFICLIFLLLRLKSKEYFFTTDFFGLKLSDLKRLLSL